MKPMQVKVKQGLLEGGKRTSILSGKEYYYFSGIPYAEPPVGDLRFQPPVPARSWKGVRSALEEANPCVQTEILSEKLVGSEDCLYLNVYTPGAPKPTEPFKPVMVYIQGGAFMMKSGTKQSLSPDYLVNHDVILVTINFRLHILGFLNLNIANCSGNCGLKDQCQALKWIKNNIRSFGGDPFNVTLFGSSSGAISIHCHMISPMSKGLFQKTILQSGNVLGHWSHIRDPERFGFRAGKLLGFDGEDPVKLVDYLKKQPVQKLVEAAEEIRRTKILGKCHEFLWDSQAVAFIPSVEKIRENAFLADIPANLIKTAEPIPVMTGVDENEGILLIYGLPATEIVENVTENLTDIVEKNLPCKSDRIPDLVDKLKEMYFKKSVDETEQEYEENLKQFLNMFSDIYFLYLYDSVDYTTKSKHPVYIYEFTFAGEFNRILNLPIKGSYHGDELGYLFYMPASLPNPNFNGPEKNVIDNLCTLWTNFAKTGNPTPDGCQLGVMWTPHTEENPMYLKIDYHLKCINEKVWSTRRNFWDGVKKTHFK